VRVDQWHCSQTTVDNAARSTAFDSHDDGSCALLTDRQTHSAE